MERRVFFRGMLVLGMIYISTGTYQKVFSQESTKNNYTGSWSDNNSWTDGSAISTTGLPAAGYNITINGYITEGAYGASQDITFSTNNDAYDFTIGSNDTLVVYGNVSFGNKAMNLVIESGGFLIILGNLDMNNKINIASDGNLIVQGTFNKTGSQGTYTGLGNVYAGAYTGDAATLVPDTQEKNTGSDLQSDFPTIWEFLDGNGSTPLPVVLTFFQGVQIQNAVHLSWQTASEQNNDYFTIEKSADGIEFEPLGNITGAGTTQEVRNYEFTDENPYHGYSYYRLKQTDFDGTTETFKPISIFLKDVHATVTIYPNPVLGGELTIFVPGAKGDVEIRMTVLNVNGTPVFDKKVSTDDSRGHFEKLDTSFLPAGNYIVNVSNNKTFTNIKLTKK